MFAAPLGGVAIDAGTGSLAGALIRLGIAEGEVGAYEGEIRSGHTLLVIRAEWRMHEAEQTLGRAGADRMDSSPGPCADVASSAWIRWIDPPAVAEQFGSGIPAPPEP